jgi:fumarate reductase subunit D
MTDLQRKSGLISAVVIALVNALAGFGVLPLDQTGVALLNTAASAIAAFVLHLIGREQ